MKKMILMMMIALAAMIGVSACSQDSDDSKQSQSSDESQQDQSSSDDKQASSEKEATGPVAVVNGKELPRKDFNTQLESMKQQYKQMGMDVSKKEDMLKKNVVDQMVGAELISQKADKEGVKVTDKELDKRYSDFTDQFKSEEQRKKAFKDNDLTEKKVKDQLKENLKISKYIDKNTEEPKVSDKEIKEQYDKMAEQQDDAPKLDKVKPTIKKQLVQQKTQKQIQSIVDKLRKEADVEVKI